MLNVKEIKILFISIEGKGVEYVYFMKEGFFIIDLEFIDYYSEFVDS